MRPPQFSKNHGPQNPFLDIGPTGYAPEDEEMNFEGLNNFIHNPPDMFSGQRRGWGPQPLTPNDYTLPRVLHDDQVEVARVAAVHPVSTAGFPTLDLTVGVLRRSVGSVPHLSCLSKGCAKRLCWTFMREGDY